MPKDTTQLKDPKDKKDEGNEPITSSAGLEFIKKSIAKDDGGAGGGAEGGDKGGKGAGTDKGPKDKKDPKAAPPKPTPKPPKAAAPIDTTALATSVATAVVQAQDEIEKKRKATPKDKGGEAEPDIFEADEHKEEIAIRERAEVLMPDKYKGKAVSAYKDSVKKLADYAKQWEKDNPGETFNEDDDAHKDFIEGLTSDNDLDDDDFERAKIDLIADRKATERVKASDDKTQGELKELRRFQRRQEEAPKIFTARDAASNEFWSKMGDEFKDVVTEDGKLNLEPLRAMAESDPIRHDEAVATAKFVEHHAAEFYMLANDLIAYAGDKPVTEKTPPQERTVIEMHKRLSDFALSAEQRMASRSPDKQVDEDGRKFVTKDQWDTLSEKEKEKHWTYSVDDLTFLFARSEAKKAVGRITESEEKFNKIAKAKGLDTGGNGNGKGAGKRHVQQEQHEEVDEVDENLDEDGKPKSPSSGAEPKSAAARLKGGDKAKSNVDTFFGRAIGKT